MAAMELNNTILKNSSNLKAYYRFESGALTTDSSGNSITLTNNNTVAEGAGVFGGAADFGTTNTNKSLSTTNTLGIDGGACSLSIWVKMRTEIGSGYMTFITLRNNTSKTFYEIYYSYNSGTRTVFFDRSKPGVGDQQVSKVIAIGTTDYHHLVLTYDATSVRGYVDGACIGTIAASGNGSNAITSGLSIGTDTAGGNPSTIIVDDAAIYNSALSADQIKELYEGRTVGELWPQSGLVGLWHLNGNSTDFSGNNNHGTDTAITYSQANGKFGQGGGFNGSSSKVVITDTSSLKPTTPFTIGAWIKTTDTSATKSIFSSFSANTNIAGVLLRIDATTGFADLVSGKNSGAIGDTDFTSVVGTRNICDGIWHLVVGTWTGTNLLIYTDGNLEATKAWANAPVYAATNYVRIGARNNTGTDTLFFNGFLDEVFLFNGVAKDANWVRKQYAWSVGKYL